jgi:hypothetical protein
LPDRTDLHNLPLNEVVYHLTGETKNDLLAQLQLDETTTLVDFDEYDLHALATAAKAGADAICSSDTIFDKIEWIPIYKPHELAAEFGL